MAKIELVNPAAFSHGAPSRIMSTEAEDPSKLGTYNRFGSRMNEEAQAREQLLSPRAFREAGIIATRQEFDESIHFWLANGAKMYLDCGEFVEYSAAENRGPKKALAATLGGMRVVSKLASTLETPSIFYRRNNIREFERDTGQAAAFQMNYLIPHEVFPRFFEDSATKKNVLSTHAATRMYTWEGMVGSEGFLLSQRALDTSHRSFFEIRDNDSYGFARLEDRNGEQGSEWGTFMALATTSVLLRIFEHPEQMDLQRRLEALTLEDPSSAMIAVSRDLSFKETLPLANGKPRSALQIQTEYAKIAAEFASQVTLPEDEQFAVDQWNLICIDIAQAAKTGDLRSLKNRIGSIKKYLWLQKQDIGPIVLANPDAVRLDMDWDMYYPNEGGRLQNHSGNEVTIVSLKEIQDTVDSPPSDTRANVRGNFIHESGEDEIDYIGWGTISGMRLGMPVNRELHPYDADLGRAS